MQTARWTTDNENDLIIWQEYYLLPWPRHLAQIIVLWKLQNFTFTCAADKSQGTKCKHCSLYIHVDQIKYSENILDCLNV